MSFLGPQRVCGTRGYGSISMEIGILRNSRKCTRDTQEGLLDSHLVLCGRAFNRYDAVHSKAQRGNCHFFCINDSNMWNHHARNFSGVGRRVKSGSRLLRKLRKTGAASTSASSPVPAGDRQAPHKSGAQKRQHQSVKQQGTVSQRPYNGSAAPKTIELELNKVPYLSIPPKTLQELYSSLCQEGRLGDALYVIKQSIRAGRDDALKTFKHYEFLRCAARKKSVHYGMKFIQLFPRKFVDARTYNMLVSVCAETGDIKNALRFADLAKASGVKLDTILYTNLIKVCAVAADANQAFELFAQMRAANVRVEKHVYATMVKACGAQIAKTHSADRREQLVLLERAYELVEGMKDDGVQPDSAVWNALISAAGKAEKLDRAFEFFNEMILRGARPTSRTYACLIDACARAGEKDTAIKLYRKALSEGHDSELVIYSAAINACVKAKEGADIEQAMDIYADLQKAGVYADSALYGSLMMAAGTSGDAELSLDLHDEMHQDGIPSSSGTESALITALVLNKKLGQAQEIYDELLVSNIVPHRHAINALINAYAKEARLGSVVSLVRDMVSKLSMKPDSFTFAAVIKACQMSGESELALEVYKLMKRSDIRIDEVHALLLIRMCYSELRATWNSLSGTQSVSKPLSIASENQRRELLEALAPSKSGAQPFEGPLLEVPWAAYACQIYRDAMNAGVKPSHRLLNATLMCLKVPNAIARGAVNSQTDLAAQTLQLHAGIKSAKSHLPEVMVQRKIGLDSVYHTQAISFAEEAIVNGVLPPFEVDSAEHHDLRDLPPTLAEVYALMILAASQRQVVEGRRYLKHHIRFLVPEYDRKKVLKSSTDEVDEENSFRQELAERYERIVADAPVKLPDELKMLFPMSDISEPQQTLSNESTGLGVAGVLRRLGLGARESGSKGTIVVEASHVARWSKRVQNEIEKRSASALAVQKPYGLSVTSGLLKKSAATIRMSD